MNNGKIAAVIGVRKGSERIVNKNIKPFNDTSLLENKIKTLKKVKNLEEIVVSTDCEKMFKLAQQLGVVAVTRPEYYTSDECPGSENLEFIAKQMDTEYILYTPVTSPLVKSETYEDIINTFRKLDDKYDSVVTMNYVKDFLWENDKPLNYDWPNHPKSQDLSEKFYKLNFGIVIISKEEFNKYNNIKTPVSDLYSIPVDESLDIDNVVEFELAEKMYEE